MKRYFFFLLFFPILSFAQSQIVKHCLPLIAAQNFTAADTYIDSILRLRPNEPDAWMMKGNSILNRQLISLKAKPVITTHDETVLSEDAYGLNNPPQILPVTVADSVERCWKKVLNADSTREDVHMGLCVLYSMSLQTEKLLLRLPLLKRMSKKGDELGYLMEDYARMFRERGKVAEANKVYAEIVKLYPSLSGVKSDWAGEYLLNDDLRTATVKANEVLGYRQIDEPTRENLVDIFLFAQQPSNAIKSIMLYAKADSNYRYAPCYIALYSFSVGDTTWKTQMVKALADKSIENDTNQVIQICKLLSSSIYSPQNFDIPMAILATPINTFCSWAIIHRAARDFKDSASIQLIAAEFYLTGKNFAVANSYLKKVLTLAIDQQTRDDVHMVYAYSSFKAGDKLTAKTLFSAIAKDLNLFKHQAALYFLAKMNNTNTDELKLLSAETKKTKYAYFADVLLNKWK